MDDKCFACDRTLGENPAKACTSDWAQTVFVGFECHKLITKAGPLGYQPPTGGPRLYRHTYCTSCGDCIVCKKCKCERSHP